MPLAAVSHSHVQKTFEGLIKALFRHSTRSFIPFFLSKAVLAPLKMAENRTTNKHITGGLHGPNSNQNISFIICFAQLSHRMLDFRNKDVVLSRTNILKTLGDVISREVALGKLLKGSD